ncbi:MAG: hypothetical protein H7124_14975 [Phycisphaerales bacterium]|nr:hypothetical protein [Hyphomonadaceae bacterium]
MRSFIAALALIALSACEMPDMEQQAAELGGQALEAASGAVHTRTACVLAGQSEAFCGCVQERLGARITREHIDDISGVVRESLSGDGIEGAARAAQNIDPATRDALIQCATHAALQGQIGEGEAAN